MKRTFLRSILRAALVIACAALTFAQTTMSNDLLQTGNGTGQEDLSSLGLYSSPSLGWVTFKGVPLSSDTGPADTIVQHAAIPNNGNTVTVNIQVIALHLMNSSTVVCNNVALCGSYYGQSVDVHATINVASATNGNITLPQPDTLDPSVGTMTVIPANPPTSPQTFTLNSSFSNIEADIIVVPPGAGVNATPIFTSKGPATAMSGSGGSMSMNPPAYYPVSNNFPTTAPYVVQLASSTAAFLTGPAGKVIRGSLWGLGCLFLGLALWTVRSTLKLGRTSWRPAYLTVVALALSLTAWKWPSYSCPTVARAEHCPTFKCNPITAEQGLLIKHGAAPAATQCQVIPCPFNPGVN
jgi:hypothetical protein